MTTLATVKLCDYQPAPYRSDDHQLTFQIFPGETLVRHRQRLQRQRPDATAAVLNGEGLELLEIRLDGKELPPARYRYENDLLTLTDLPESAELETLVRIHPEENSALSGLYCSGGIYCTQCEAEGFRRISFACDRPDVLSTFRVRIESPFRVSLSNGNLLSEGDLGDGRHFSEWHDPHPKPTYLFALVAGELSHIGERFTSPKGVAIDLRIYSAKEFLDQCQFALEALKDAIVWDEQRFNLSYDLNRFNIVAIGDFNMGAMENKSLNIFNTRCVLADSETSTDEDFRLVHGVIAHEYFHNWTGNRITCRDWFQLSLKEGLTVFRDQEFSADHGERFLERIKEIQRLRAFQFPEDSGPLRHPVQPQEYAAIDNFYTATVYEKGAEIIRMYHSILGEERFQQGMARYIQSYDGQAVRIEDFATAMSSDFYDFRGPFFDWYLTAGTPRLTFSADHDAAAKRFTLTVRQEVDAVEPPRPLVIPIRLGLLDSAGRHYDFGGGQTQKLLLLEGVEASWTFADCEQSIPALLEDFSAPVYYHYDYRPAELQTLIEHSDDGFVRYEAMQLFYRRALDGLLAGDKGPLQQLLTVAETVRTGPKSPGEKALLLGLPALETLLNFLAEPYDLDAILPAYERLQSQLSAHFGSANLRAQLDALGHPPPRWTPAAAGVRWLKAVLRDHLDPADPANREWLRHDYRHAPTMTDRLSALQALARRDDEARTEALADFHERFAAQPLVLDKWFAVQARAAASVAELEALAALPSFNPDNPNRSRALLLTLARFNLAQFHRADGGGYRFFAAQLKRIITRNPQNASRLLNAFALSAKLDAGRRARVAAVLDDLAATPGLAVEVQETLERLRRGG